MATLTPIPTTYRGVDFRSRLEAEWALNLDAWGITWCYEPNGYQLAPGVRYLPDFWLPDITTWLEVKGPGVAGTDKATALACAANNTLAWATHAVVIGRPARAGYAHFEVACRFCSMMIQATAPNDYDDVVNGHHAFLATCQACELTQFCTRCDGDGVESRCWPCEAKVELHVPQTFQRLRWNAP